MALAVEVAKQGWQSATNVILARDDQFSDALAAAPLSKKLDAPILMTDSTVIAEGIRTETETIPFDVVTKVDSSLVSGETKITQSGSDGEKEINMLMCKETTKL